MEYQYMHSSHGGNFARRTRILLHYLGSLLPCAGWRLPQLGQNGAFAGRQMAQPDQKEALVGWRKIQRG